MSKKVFALVAGIIGGVQAIAIALVTFLVPAPVSVAVNSAIVIGCTAVTEICNLFVKPENKLQ